MIINNLSSYQLAFHLAELILIQGFFESYQEKQQQLAQYISDWEQNLERLEELKRKRGTLLYGA